MTIDCEVDEGVGPEDFVEPGKQPFDHDCEPFYCMTYSTSFRDVDHVMW